MAPVRAMADTVDRLGPTSLGLRLRQDGPRDETRALADAVDAMLDRVAVGYEAQRRFAANASHELRTPLATQRALIEISLGSARTAEQLELVAQQLLATNERNERLVDGLLTLAETERGLMARAPQPLDRIVRDAVDGQRAFAKERGVELDRRGAAGHRAGRAAAARAARRQPRAERDQVQPRGRHGTGDRSRPAACSSSRTPARSCPPTRCSSCSSRSGGRAASASTTAAAWDSGSPSPARSWPRTAGEITARANDGGGLTVEVQLPAAR